MSDRSAFNEWEHAAWETRAVPYADGLAPMTVGSVAGVLEAVGAEAGTRLLDVGCGPGVLAAQAVARGCIVTGVDVSEAMVALARSQVPAAEFRVGSAESLPTANKEFGAVCGNFVLPHLGHPQRAIAEALRVVESRGRIAFTEWDAARQGAFKPFWSAFEGCGMPMPPGVPPGPELDHSDRATMRATFEAAGAIDVEVLDLDWTFSVDPNLWWHAIVESTPRTGGRIKAADAEARAAFRAHYDRELAQFERDGDLVVFPCGAIVGVGTRP